MDINVTQLEELRARLKDLRIEHRALDEEIKELDESAYIDHLHLRRLKKRKLQLKETVVKLESKLIPDLNA